MTVETVKTVETVPSYDAIVLAGGRARRLGGLDKPGEPVGGRSLIERVASAVPGAGRLIVVGPRRPGSELPHAVFAMEDPPGGGPVVALRTGLAFATAEWIALLAADLPFLAAPHVSRLFGAAVGMAGGAAGTGAAGAVLIDDDGREQWLTGVWRTRVVRQALAGYEGRSLFGLLGPLSPVRLYLPPGADGCAPWFDCDTMDDLSVARQATRITRQTRE